jgi:hypothetical protein
MRLSAFDRCAGSGQLYDERVQTRVPQDSEQRIYCHVCQKKLRLRPYAFGDGFQLPAHKDARRDA